MSGVVLGDGNRPLAGSEVTFHRENAVAAVGRTGSDGRYSVRLASGDYGVSFAHDQGGYIPEDFDDGAEFRYGSFNATPVLVRERDVSDVSAHLVRPATVRGRLVAGARPVSEYFVRFSRVVAGSDYVSDFAQNEDGTFEFTHVTPGEYDVALEPTGAPAGYADSVSFHITVPSGGLVDVPTKRLAAYKDLGTLDLDVTAGYGPLRLIAYPAGQAGRIETVQGSPTKVSFGRLPAGSYVLSNGEHGWVGGRSIHTARRFTVKAGRTLRASAAIGTTRSVYLQAKNRRGFGIPGVTALVYRAADPAEVVAVAATGEGGGLQIDGLSPADYRVVLDDPSGEYTRRTIAVAANDISDFVVTMEHRSLLPSLPRDRTASLEIDREAYGWTLFAADDPAAPIRDAEIDSTRRKSVPAGNYKIKLTEGGWFGGVSFSEATTVVLATGDRKTLTVPAIGSTGTVQGQVRGSDGALVPGAVVTVFRAGSRTVVDQVRNDYEFAFNALPVRTYKIRVADPTGRYATRWVGGGTTFDTAATFTPHITDATSAGTTVLPLRFVAMTSPVVKGAAAVGKVLTATSGRFTKSYSWAARRWLRDGKPIKGATKTTYRLTTGDAGHRITYALAVRRKGGDPTARSTSVPTAVVKRR